MTYFSFSRSNFIVIIQFQSPVVDSGDPQQQDAALKIQTEYRRHAAANEVESMKEEDAALTIQSSFRGHQDREKVKQMM